MLMASGNVLDGVFEKEYLKGKKEAEEYGMKTKRRIRDAILNIE